MDDWSTDVFLERVRERRNREDREQRRIRRNRINLLAFRLLERYDGLHSANCKAPKDYRRTLLARLERILPLSSRKERVINGHVIIPEE